jgi:hypothetical protein
MPQGSTNSKDNSRKSYQLDAILTASRQLWATIQLTMFNLGCCNIGRLKDDNSQNANANHQEEVLQGDDGSTQKLEH